MMIKLAKLVTYVVDKREFHSLLYIVTTRPYPPSCTKFNYAGCAQHSEVAQLIKTFLKPVQPWPDRPYGPGRIATKLLVYTP